MGSANEEKSLRKNTQTREAPGCKLADLFVVGAMVLAKSDASSSMRGVHEAAILTMMWHTWGRTIGTCFARKHQLAITASGRFSSTSRASRSRWLKVREHLSHDTPSHACDSAWRDALGTGRGDRVLG